MPRVAKWVADLMDNAFSSKFRAVTVINTEYVDEDVKKITFAGDFSSIKFEVGQAVIIRVDDNNYRNYTPCFWDSKTGICEVLFHLHGNGPGSNYIEALTIGDAINLGLPRGFNLYKKESKYHFFFGDETTLGLFKSLKDAININDQNYIGVMELEDPQTNALDKMDLLLDVVAKSANKAENAIKFLQMLDDTLWTLWKTGAFYLMGNAKSIQQFRKALREHGIPSKNIVTQPFWVEGKVGL